MKKFIYILLTIAILSIALVIIFLPKSDSIKTTELKPIKTFGGIDVPEEAILSSPSDMVISEEGEIIVSDSRENQIFIFDTDGNVVNKIGRPGKGPGELQGPGFIVIKNDTIKVFERGNNRIHYFLKNGQSLRMIPCKFSVSIGSFIFGINEDVFFATNGFRTAHLIRHYLETGEKLDPIGEIEGHSFQIYEMLKIRDALIKKDVPDALKNDIMLIFAPEGRLYAVFQALPLIKIYSPSGELEEVAQLNLPEFEKARIRCSEDNLEGKQKGSPGFWPLRFWRDGVITESGDLILLISDPDKMILYRFSKDGKLILRYECVEDNIRMVALHGSYLWAYGRETQIFYQFKIEK
jgi:hypothetical protein